VSHKEDANFIRNHGVLVDADDNGNSGLPENLSNLLRVARRDKGDLYLVVILAEKFIEPALVELVCNASAPLFKQQVKLLQVLVEVAVAREMNQLRVHRQSLFQALEVHCSLHYFDFLLVHFEDVDEFVEFLREVQRASKWLNACLFRTAAHFLHQRLAVKVY